MAETDRCTDVLGDALRGYQGIDSLHFDVQKGRLELAYDPRLIRDEAALAMVERVGRNAAGLVAHCARRSPAECAQCVATMQGQLLQHFATGSGVPSAVMQGNEMEIVLHPATLPAAEMTSIERTFPLEEPGAPREHRPRIGRDRLEVVFTAVSLAALLIAAAASALGAAPLAAPALYTLSFAAGGVFGLIDGLRMLRAGRLDVNLLMILAALGAAAIGQPAEGAVLLFLFSLSNTLQSYAMDRSRRAIEKLIDLRPPQASVRRGARIVTLPVEQLVLGDRVLVRPGERIPVDGEILAGQSDVDQSAITGESVPVTKTAGDHVFAGTLNAHGALEIRLTHLARDTTLAKIIKLVEEAQSSRARTQRMIDDFEQIYAVLVLAGAALLTLVPWLLLQQAFGPTFYRAMTWLVVASPCALVISTPASILSAIATGARHGVLFKGGAHLEQMGRLKVVAFDKTGTLTSGKPSVTRILPLGGLSEDELLREAAAVEARSEHPLAGAIVAEAQRRGLALPSATDFLAIPGQGVEARVDEEAVWVGAERMFFTRRVNVPRGVHAQVEALEGEGQTVMLVYRGGAFRGLLAVADTLRPGAAEFVRQLKSLGIERVVMLTGDNERVAAQIAAQSGVDEYHPGLLPEDKVAVLKSLRDRYGPTAMVGDGVNDAPALASADLGIAMGGAGSDVALETADVVLMSDEIGRLPYAIALSRQARRVIKQNLVFALSVIVLLVVAAFGVQLPLPLGVVGHEGSTVLVVLNGLRLLAFRYVV